MKTFLIAIFIASLSFGVYGAQMANLKTGKVESTPQKIANIDNPDLATLLKSDYRLTNALPDIAAGYERSEPRWIEGDGTNATPVYTDTRIADRLAAEVIAASNAAYQASLPRQEPTGIEAPVVVLTDSDGKGWGVVADGGDLVTYQDHASPRPDAATIAARVAAARATNAVLRADLVAVRTNTAQNIQDCQALTATNFTGAARTTINTMQAELVDVNRQLQALRKILAQHIRSEQ